MLLIRPIGSISLVFAVGCGVTGPSAPASTGSTSPQATAPEATATQAPSVASSVAPLTSTGPTSAAPTSTASAPSAPSAPSEAVGSAKLLPDGTIVLTMFNPHALLRYPKTHPDYANVRDHVGPLAPGEEKVVAPFPPSWPKK